jgi:hypothetical protein
MLFNRPKSLVIIAALLALLALLSLTSTLTSRTAFGIPNARQPGAAGGNFQPGGALPQGGNNNGGNFQGRNNGNFQRGGGFNAFSLFRTAGINLNPQVMLYANLGITILGILLTLLSAFGVWKQKKWGLNLGMVIALLFLLSAAPGLFTLGGRNLNWLRTSITVLTVVASLPIIAMGALPSVRDWVS